MKMKRRGEAPLIASTILKMGHSVQVDWLSCQETALFRRE
jgi:hypothetical protein